MKLNNGTKWNTDKLGNECWKVQKWGGKKLGGGSVSIPKLTTIRPSKWGSFGV